MAREVPIAITQNLANALRFGVQPRVSGRYTWRLWEEFSRGNFDTVHSLLLDQHDWRVHKLFNCVLLHALHTLLPGSDLFLTDFSVGDRMWADEGGGLASPDPLLGASRIRVLFYDLHCAIHRFAGRDFTEDLTKIFTRRGYFFTAPAERAIARDVFERLCFIE